MARPILQRLLKLRKVHEYRRRIAKEQESLSLEKRAEGTTQNTASKRRAEEEGVDSNYLFANSFAFCFACIAAAAAVT